MFVTDCFSGNEEYTSDEAKVRMAHGNPNKSITLVRSVAGLCNAAEFDASTLDRPLHAAKVFGDPTDQAILRLSQSLGPVKDLRERWKKMFEIPFNSKNKFMARIMKSVDQDSA